jgi:predicted methyltransferase MtxX (methanogen marker protein 4)
MLQGLAEAFAHTFVWGFVVMVLAMIAASFLPRKRVDPTPSSITPGRNGLTGTTRQVQRIIR